MNSKHTLNWLIVAVALFAFIFAWRHFEQPAPPPPPEILPNLHPGAVTAVQIIPNNAPEISVVHTNGSWVMTQPVLYPADGTAIEALLDALQKLKPAVRLSAADLSQNHNANSDYGFESPRASLVIQSGDDRQIILVGNKTEPGDQVFLRIVGSDGVIVADTAWLKWIPSTANDWRDTSLADLSGAGGCDSIIITNGATIIELHCNPTNHLWEMTRPLTARANNGYITAALQQLQSARVSQFVTDNSNADLTAYGLQPADLNLTLGLGTNVLASIDLGKSPAGDRSEVFARRDGWDAVVATAKKPLSYWYGQKNDFRDPYLVDLTGSVGEIEMIGPGTNDFVLDHEPSGGWKFAGDTMPADSDNVQSLIQILAELRVSQFTKDVVTPADLPAYGLNNPVRQIILRSTPGDTNSVIAHLLFGDSRTNVVYVQRADEDFIYGITPQDFAGVFTDGGRVPDGRAWQFRDLGIWNFSETNVTQITVRENGKVRQINHLGPNEWALAAGSQGIINAPAMEEVAHELGTLNAAAWMARDVTNPAPFGLSSTNLSVTVTLRGDKSRTLDFGSSLGQTALAAVTIEGQRWVFIFPPAIYEFILPYLSIPANVP